MALKRFRALVVRVVLAVGKTPNRQIHHTTAPHNGATGLALCPCLRRFSITKQQIVMIELRIAALANARKPGFSAFISSDVKTPTGNSAAYKQAARQRRLVT